MKTLIMVLVSALSLSLSSQVMAKAELAIEWQKPEKFTDVRPTNQSSTSFRNATFNTIEQYLRELTADLADHHKLVIKVTNLDLAGQVWPASHLGLGHNNADIRVIKNHYIPRMAFSYELLDASGAVTQQNEVKLKDMSFFDSSTGFHRNDSLRYEKSMLKAWFETEFASQIIK